MVSEAWKNLPPEEREYWEEMARADKERYEMEKSFYDGPWKIPAEKSSKDPRAPKRPMSAFLAYSNNKRSEVKQNNPSLSNADISRLLASMWKEVNNEEKQHYIEEEMKLREDYKFRIAEWRANEEIEIDLERKKREEMTLRSLESHKQQLTAATNAAINTTTHDGARMFQIESSPGFFPPHAMSHQSNYGQDLTSDHYYGESNNTMTERSMSFAYQSHPSHHQNFYHQAPYHYPMPYQPRMDAPYGGAHFRSGISFHSDPSPYNLNYYNPGKYPRILT
jgi:HMG (high mobility group) box